MLLCYFGGRALVPAAMVLDAPRLGHPLCHIGLASIRSSVLGICWISYSFEAKGFVLERSSDTVLVTSVGLGFVGGPAPLWAPTAASGRDVGFGFGTLGQRRSPREELQQYPLKEYADGGRIISSIEETRPSSKR